MEKGPSVLELSAVFQVNVRNSLKFGSEDAGVLKKVVKGYGFSI